jgi:hypothetical protein
MGRVMTARRSGRTRIRAATAASASAPSKRKIEYDMLLSPMKLKRFFMLPSSPIAGRRLELGQRGAQTAEQERHQAGNQAVVAVDRIRILDFPIGDQAQRIGAGNRVGRCAEHEVEAPDDLGPRHVRQWP